MDEKSRALQEWVASADAYCPLSWDRLPELELYMDQVITFMNRQLELFSVNGERLLTPSMINNYVKDGVLPRPTQKKCGRDHLVMLQMICMMKSVLSLPEIDAALQGIVAQNEAKAVYSDFSNKQSAALQKVIRRIGEKEDRSEAELYRLAMELALEANACHIAAARILDSLTSQERATEKEKERAREKAAKKNKKAE